MAYRDMGININFIYELEPYLIKLVGHGHYEPTIPEVKLREL